MKKIFFKLTMLLFLLGMSVNAAWAIHISDMTRTEAEDDGFWARLTAKSATTTSGRGKVFVSEDDDPIYPEPEDYRSEYSADGWGDVYVMTSLVDGDIHFHTYALADDGSYFTGWSFTDGYADLGKDAQLAVKVTPSSTRGHSNIREHSIFAAFEPIRLVSYEITGSNTTEDDGDGNWICTQIIRFRAETPNYEALSSGEAVRHFELPAIVRKEGTTGTWETSITEWTTSNIAFYGDYAILSVPVTFTAPNGNAAEYGATVTLETKAGVAMKVYLYARTQGGSGEAILYDKDKVELGRGDLTDMIAAASSTDVVKLNANYSNAVSVNKDITLDLNGYALSNMLTVSGGNVTLAYSPYGGSLNSMIVSGGKAILNGGTIGLLTISSGATVEQNGATITGPTNNNGTLTTTDGIFRGELTSSKTLTANGGTFRNTSGVAITVTGGTAQIKRGVISAATYGVQTTGGATTIEKLAAITGDMKALYGNGGALTVNSGKFTDPADLKDGTVTFNAGYFQTNNAGTATVFEKQVWRNTAGPEAREGYDFFVGDQAAAQASNVSVCRIGHASYSSLEDALAFANNSGQEVIIIMENDYTLPAGYYTLPANATLVVPMSDEQETDNPIIPRSSTGTPTPVSFRRLIFSDGVNINVQGTIELSCTQYGAGETMGIPGGNYGHLIMKPGSRMTINGGGELRAWGFVTGDGSQDAEGNYLSGEIDARRGATVREMFQMGDWKGGDISFTLAMEMPNSERTLRDLTHLFPVYTYFIQNVESPVKYHPGSSLICATSVNVSGNINAYANDIKVVGKEGEPAMFLMNEMADAENTWVRKWYDVKNDKQVYDVNSGAQLGSVVIDLGEVPGSMFGGSGTYNFALDSRSFVLPLTSNFKIHLLSGYMEFTQSTSCLPGMEVEVDKESEVAIVNYHHEDVVEGALYLYDADQWSFDGSHGYVGNAGKFGAIVRYSATLDRKPTARSVSSPSAIGDAKLNVHGTFRMGADCAVYTTWSKDASRLALDENGTGGASIISTNEDAGTFIFDAVVPAFEGITLDGDGKLVSAGANGLINYDHNDYGIAGFPVEERTVLGSTYRIYGWELCTPAKLKNGDGTFAITDGTAAGMSYCYMNDRWTLMEVAPENECFMKDNYGTFYAKPAEYVAVAAEAELHDEDPENPYYEMIGNEDHTFSDAAGTGRLFILMEDGCQWWEVENVDNLYHCIHPNNDTYYYWDDFENAWMEQRFLITWLNWDGTDIKSYTYNPSTGEPEEVDYSVTYGTMAEYLGPNPTREANIDYTYDFVGWSPELGRVTSDVTYMATYVEKPRKYTIIFQTEGGVEIERHFLTHNEIPVCENIPTQTGFTLEWSPAIAAVTGDATYRATWLEEPPTEYAVTFYDFDGATKLKPTGEEPYMVAVGAMPIAPENPTGKADWAESEGNKEFTYVFDHWSPALEEVSATSVKSYVAVYNEVPKTYTISYFMEDGETPNPTKPYEVLTYGAAPTPPAVTKEDPEEGWTYMLMWMTLDGSSTITNVMDDASYMPVYMEIPNRYTVTLKSNLSGVCTFTGAGIYDYGTDVNIEILYDDTKYSFDGWSDGETESSRTISSLNDNITLTANFTPVALENKTVAKDETWNVPADTEIKDLIITSDGSACGQLLNPENLTIRGEAIYRIQQTFAAGTWYAVAVPWRVNPATGIYGASSRLASGSQIYVIEFDGAAYANTGVTDDTYQYWHFLNETGGDMVPGKLYMIWLASGQSKLDFHKKAGAALQTRNLTVSTASGSVGESFNNWNAISNPALYTADLSTGVTKYQTYDNNDAETYTLVDAATEDLIVAKPIFVQVTTPGTVYATVSSSSAPAPYRTAPQVENESKFVVEISRNNKMADRLIIETADEKADEYVIGQDLAKFGVSSKVAQMWINRYDAKLCVNVVEMENERAEYPLSIFAPADGEYTLSAAQRRGEMALYLTYNGEAIANLSESAYTLTLNRGTAFGYGLRISPKMPQVTTGVDELIINSKDATATKVLINNKVYIIRGEKVYTVDGQLVK